VRTGTDSNASLSACGQRACGLITGKEIQRVKDNPARNMHVRTGTDSNASLSACGQRACGLAAGIALLR